MKIFKNLRKILSELYIPEFFIQTDEEMEKMTRILMKDFARSLYQNINERFAPNELASNFKIFSMQKIRQQRVEDLSSFGRVELDALIDHFGFEKYYLGNKFIPIINNELIRNEWKLLKFILNKNPIDKSENETWPIVYETFNEKYPNITTLILLKEIAPLTSVQCERGFSTLNYVKNDCRNLLGK